MAYEDIAPPEETKEREIFDALVRLGDNPEQVAESLERKGVTGVPGEAKRCPIANYLNEEFGGTFVVNGYDICGPWSLSVFSAPDPVARFVADFDSRLYPVLIREGA